MELPGDTNRSELHFFTPNPDQALSVPKKMAWMTGMCYTLRPTNIRPEHF